MKPEAICFAEARDVFDGEQEKIGGGTAVLTDRFVHIKNLRRKISLL